MSHVEFDVRKKEGEYFANAFNALITGVNYRQMKKLCVTDRVVDTHDAIIKPAILMDQCLMLKLKL